MGWRPGLLGWMRCHSMGFPSLGSLRDARSPFPLRARLDAPVPGGFLLLSLGGKTRVETAPGKPTAPFACPLAGRSASNTLPSLGPHSPTPEAGMRFREATLALASGVAT